MDHRNHTTSFLTDTIEREMRKLFRIPDEKETRLWCKYMRNSFEPLNKLNGTVVDTGLFTEQVRWSSIIPALWFLSIGRY